MQIAGALSTAAGTGADLRDQQLAELASAGHRSAPVIEKIIPGLRIGDRGVHVANDYARNRFPLSYGGLPAQYRDAGPGWLPQASVLVAFDLGGTPQP